MSWDDALKSAVGNLVGQAEQGAVPDLLQNALGAEGLQSVVGKLQDAGFEKQVSSWLDSNKGNLPITAEQIKTALGDEHVQEIARSLGIPVDAILSTLAKYLPDVVSAGGQATAAPAAPSS